MKSFFEEYGFVILAAIVVILLIAMATPIGDLVKTQIDGVINSFGSKTQSKLNATDGVINVRVKTANNKITLEWDAVKKEDKFRYQYKATNTSKDANWTTITEVPTGSDKTRKIEISTDSSGANLANKTKVEYKIYDSNEVLVASGITTAKIGINASNTENGGGESGTVNLTTGQKISIEGKEYTVIENVQGNQYKVFAPVSPARKFDASSNNYATSEIATYLDGDYYNSLPENIRKAIVETSIQQTKLNAYTSTNPTDWGAKTDTGTHKVFLPSWDEVTKAYGTTPDNLKAFAPSGWTWLRDTYSSFVLCVYGYGNLGNGSPNFSVYVRPAFVLDLSKVSYNNG